MASCFGLLLVFVLWSESIFLLRPFMFSAKVLSLFNMSLFTLPSLPSILYSLITGLCRTVFVLSIFTCALLTWLPCPLNSPSTLLNPQLDLGIFSSSITTNLPIWTVGCLSFVVASFWFSFKLTWYSFLHHSQRCDNILSSFFGVISSPVLLS